MDFLTLWIIDAATTVALVLLSAIFFGNAPITFIIFFVYPIAFIIICAIIVDRKRGNDYEI